MARSNSLPVSDTRSTPKASTSVNPVSLPSAVEEALSQPLSQSDPIEQFSSPASNACNSLFDEPKFGGMTTQEVMEFLSTPPTEIRTHGILMKAESPSPKKLFSIFDHHTRHSVNDDDLPQVPEYAESKVHAAVYTSTTLKRFTDIIEDQRYLAQIILTKPKLDAAIKFDAENVITNTIGPAATLARNAVEQLNFLNQTLNWESINGLSYVRDVLHAVNGSPSASIPLSGQCQLRHTIPCELKHYSISEARAVVDNNSQSQVLFECTKRAIDQGIIPDLDYQSANEVPGFVVSKSELAMLVSIEHSKHRRQDCINFYNSHFPFNENNRTRHTVIPDEHYNHPEEFISHAYPRTKDIFKRIPEDMFAPDLLIIAQFELSQLIARAVDAALTEGFNQGFAAGRASAKEQPSPTPQPHSETPAPEVSSGTPMYQIHQPHLDNPKRFSSVNPNSWAYTSISIPDSIREVPEFFNNAQTVRNDIGISKIHVNNPSPNPFPSPPIAKTKAKSKSKKVTPVPKADAPMNVDTVPIPEPPARSASPEPSVQAPTSKVASEKSNDNPNPWSKVGKKKVPKKDKFIPVPLDQFFETETVDVAPENTVENPFVSMPNDHNPTVRGKPIQIPNPPSSANARKNGPTHSPKKNNPNLPQNPRKSFAAAAKTTIPDPPLMSEDKRDLPFHETQYGSFPIGVLPERVAQLAKQHPKAPYDVLIGLAHNEYIIKQAARSKPKVFADLKVHQINKEQRRKIFIKYSTNLHKQFKDNAPLAQQYFTRAFEKNKVPCKIVNCVISHRDTITLTLDQIPTDNVVNYVEWAASKISSSSDFAPRVSRFEFTSTLYIPAVPTVPRNGGRRFSQEQYHSEILRNKGWSDVTITSVSARAIKGVTGQCQLFVNIVDEKDWSIMGKLRDKPISNFQEMVTPRVSNSNSEANIPRCDKCQKWGHVTKRCLNVIGVCCKCGGRHLTSHHNLACQRCNEDYADEPFNPNRTCSHLPYCANCGGIHRADSTSCVFFTMKRQEGQHRNMYLRFANKPSYEEAVTNYEEQQEANKSHIITDNQESDSRSVLEYAPNSPEPHSPRDPRTWGDRV